MGTVARGPCFASPLPSGRCLPPSVPRAPSTARGNEFDIAYPLYPARRVAHMAHADICMRWIGSQISLLLAWYCHNLAWRYFLAILCELGLILCIFVLFGLCTLIVKTSVEQQVKKVAEKVRAHLALLCDRCRCGQSRRRSTQSWPCTSRRCAVAFEWRLYVTAALLCSIASKSPN